MPICAAPFLAQGAKGAEQAGTPVLSVLALDPIEGIPQLETLAVEAVPIRTLLPRQLSDTATILYTSGTTGKSKEGGAPALRYLRPDLHSQHRFASRCEDRAAAEV